MMSINVPIYVLKMSLPKTQHQACFLVWVVRWSPHWSLELGWYTNIQINFHAYQQLDTRQQGTFLTKPNKKILY